MSEVAGRAFSGADEAGRSTSFAKAARIPAPSAVRSLRESSIRLSRLAIRYASDRQHRRAAQVGGLPPSSPQRISTTSTPGLARRRPRPHHRHAADPAARAPILALEGRPATGTRRIVRRLRLQGYFAAATSWPIVTAIMTQGVWPSPDAYSRSRIFRASSSPRAAARCSQYLRSSLSIGSPSPS